MLPKIKHVTFSVTQPSTGIKLTMRPFTVKEEKILLLAQSDTEADGTDAVKQVLNNCMVTDGVDIEKLPMFDIEYLFVKLRAKSVNNVINFTVKEDAEDGEEPFEYPLSIDLDAVEIVFDPEHNKKVTINDNMGFVMKYPTMNVIETVKGHTGGEVELMFTLLANCLDKIYEGDQLFVAGVDFNDKEAIDFIESLPADVFEKVQKFFDTIPRLEYTVEYVTRKGETKKIELKGMQDFFRF